MPTAYSATIQISNCEMVTYPPLLRARQFAPGSPRTARRPPGCNQLLRASLDIREPILRPEQLGAEPESRGTGRQPAGNIGSANTSDRPYTHTGGQHSAQRLQVSRSICNGRE